MEHQPQTATSAAPATFAGNAAATTRPAHNRRSSTALLQSVATRFHETFPVPPAIEEERRAAPPARSWLITDQLAALFATGGAKEAAPKEDVPGAAAGADKDATVAAATKVSVLSLLSYSTTKEKALMLLGLCFAVVSGCAVPVWLILLAKGLDQFSNLGFLINAGADLQSVLVQELNKLVIGFAVLGVVSMVAGSAYVSLWTYTGEKQALRIKERYVVALFHKDAAWFDAHNRDELPTKVANAMIHINGAIGRQMADLFANLWSSAGCLAVALCLNTPLALIMLLIVPVVVLCIAVLACFIRRHSRRAGQSLSHAGALATEVLGGIKTVAALCAEPWALRSYGAHVGAAQAAGVRGGAWTALSSGLTALLFYVTYTAAFFIGTEQVADNASSLQFVVCLIAPWVVGVEFPPWWITAGLPTGEDLADIYDANKCRVTGASVMCCIYGVILSATFFGLMAPALQAINLGRQAAADIFSTIQHSPDIDPRDGSGEKPETLKGEICMDGVYFSYPTRPRDILYKDFSLTAKAGSTLAICGPSGCGKSTIARLLLRFYDPLEGSVRVDGTPLQKLNLEWWRSKVGYVAQEPVMFPGTIYENIAMGSCLSHGSAPLASHDEVVAAAKIARCYEFIMEMPEQFDTFYSGASVQLSGGQMQRICIARAMVRNPSILILDESTSALDSNSERQVQDAIDRIRDTKPITIISVAHRLSTIVNSDKIAVISNGRIAEQGTHQELLALKGIYTSLCASQGISADSKFEREIPSKPLGGSVKYSPLKRSSKALLMPSQAMGSAEEGVELDKSDIEIGDLIGDEEDSPEEEKLASRARLWELNRPEWWYVLLGGLGSCMVGALPPCEGILTAQIVNTFYTVSTNQMLDVNRIYILNFLTLGAGALIGNLMAGCGFSVSGYRLTRRMREQVFEAMVRRNAGWFDFPEHSVGELTTRLEADAEAVAKVTGWALGYRVRVLATLAAGITISLYYAWQVGLSALLCAPLIMAAAIIQRICLSKRFVQDSGKVSAPTLLEQGLRGIASVQAYGLEEKMCDDFATALVPESKGKVQMGLVAGFVFGFSQFAVFCTFAVTFYVGSQLLVNVKVDFATFFTAILAIMFGALGIAQVTVDFNAQQDGLAAAQRIFSIIDEPLDALDPLNDDGEKPASIEGAISFENITFAYPSRPNHLVYRPAMDGKWSGFSLKIEPKTSVAFVGGSGSGKSTALQLFLKFYEANSGLVKLDGADVRNLNTRWLRSHCGYVGQMPYLFKGTVKENILMGKPKATDTEVIEAAKAANAHGFVTSLNAGYNTDIGSGGMLLSGGQRQRIAIARAVISDPSIMILDEATAALDNESERVVQAALDELQAKQPRTTLVVAHRLGTVKKCDKIAVLDDGGVKELGDHEALLQLKGLYHELWTKQGGDS